MAIVWYTDATSGDNVNSGSSEGAAKVTGTAAETDGTAVIALDASSDLADVVVGDTIRVVGRSDGIRSTELYEITAVDDGADTVNVTPSPAADTGQTWRIGGAFKTIQSAVSAEEDPDIIWIKGGTSYKEAVSGVTNGNPATPITWEGYTTTTGDGGVAIIDGEDTRAIGVNFATGFDTHHHFKNLAFINHTSYGAGGGASADNSVFYLCRFSNNTLGGANPGKFCSFIGCTFEGGVAGLVPGTGVGTTFTVMGCVFRNHTGFGIAPSTVACPGGECTGMIVTQCVFQNSAGGIQRTNGNGVIFIVGNTFQGIGPDRVMVDAIDLIGSANFPGTPLTICNNVIQGCTRGITGRPDGDTAGVALNNLFFNNGTNKVDFTPISDGDLTTDPLLTSTIDPTPTSSSPVHNAAFSIVDAPTWTGIGKPGPIGVTLGQLGSGIDAQVGSSPFYPLSLPGI